MIDQSCPDWIVTDVLYFGTQAFVAAENVVERLVLPQRASSLDRQIRAIGGGPFEPLHDFCEWMRLHWSKNRMAMVRHDRDAFKPAEHSMERNACLKRCGTSHGRKLLPPSSSKSDKVRLSLFLEVREMAAIRDRVVTDGHGAIVPRHIATSAGFYIT